MIPALGCSLWPSTHWRNLFLLSWLIYYLWNIHDFKFQLRLVRLPVIFMFKVGLIPCIQQWEASWKGTFSPSSSRKKYRKLAVWDAAGPSIPCNSFWVRSLHHFTVKVISLPVLSFKTPGKFRCTIKSRCCTSHSKTLYIKKKMGSNFSLYQFGCTILSLQPLIVERWSFASLSREHFATWTGQHFPQDPETPWRVWDWTFLTHGLINGYWIAFRSPIN